MNKTFRPADHQPPLSQKHFILENEKPGDEAVPMDILFVGAGPAGLVGAIRLAQLVKAANEAGNGPGDVQIGVLEKASQLGGHTLSGAVFNPRVLRELFPDLKDEDFPFQGKVAGDQVYLLTETGSTRIPTPPQMHNSGHHVISLCEMVRWLGQKAEELGVNIFTSFPADSLLTEGGRVIGVRTTPQGLNRDGQPGSQFMPSTDITAKITILTEGTRGPLTESYRQWKGISSRSPQIYALGVKELWRVKKQPTSVTHTMGWPLPSDAFGGSFMYPVGDDMLAFGLVVGLDYKESTLDTHALLQKLKNHPLFSQYLEGGELLEWGAKTIPEGGFHALPEAMHGDGLLMAGDCVGFVNVPALKGIHYAMESGMHAAQTCFEALVKNDVSANALKIYDQRIRDSFIWRDLKKVRNMRFAFKSGFWGGTIRAGLMTVTGGAFPGDPSTFHEDADEPKVATEPTATATAAPTTPTIPFVSKVDGVYRAGNKTRDDIPSHLTVGKDIPKEVAQMYAAMCPAGVYELKGDQLVVNAPNCVDCKATDVLGPRWQPREGGSGPNYQMM